ncbi:MAG: hypothetical protein AB8I08_05565 [Sandaracinaceae bacterium]
MRLVLLTLCLVAVPVSASAQLTQSLEPSEVELPPPDDANVDDETVIRWAAQEVARAQGRTVNAHPPLPPEPYLGQSEPMVPTLSLDGDPLSRVFAELGLGAIGALVGFGIGALTIWVADEAGASADGQAIAIGASAMVAGLAVTAGVTLGAEVRGGRGNFGHAFLGMLVGSAVAIPFIVYGLAFAVEGAALAAGLVLPLVGGVLGYEIGHANGAPRSRAPMQLAYGEFAPNTGTSYPPLR